MERNLDDIQKSVDDWIKQNSGYWPPLGMLAAVMEEVGEVSREILHLTSTKIKKSSEPKNSLETELGDLFYAIVCIANSYNISLDSALKKSMDKFQTRDNERFSKEKK
jgi:NTP pyrophosphatase (non-canonical NTP hydrolase)